VAELPQVSFDNQEYYDINHLDGVAGGDDTLPLPLEPADADASKGDELRKKLAFRTSEKPRAPRMLPAISGRIGRPEFGQSFRSEIHEWSQREEGDFLERQLPMGDYLKRMYGGG
jgi:hypothetical protein